MSGFDWNDVLRLPEQALAGDRRIPKTVIASQAGLTKTEQRALDRVSRISHVATVQKSNTRIPPTIDGERDIQSIVFLRCELARGAAYSEAAHLLHKCFPNPTVILFGGGAEAYISASITRRSLAEQGTAVIDSVESTGAFDPDEAAMAPFLDSLAFERLPQRDLLAYLEGITWSIRLSRAVPSLGFFPSCGERDREQLETLIARGDALSSKAVEVRKLRRNRDLTLNESAKLRMELRKLEGDLRDIICEIKEICNG